MLSDADLMAIRKPLVAQFGEDLAQHALLNLWEALSKGIEIQNPLAFCRLVIRRERQDLARKQDGVGFYSIDPFLLLGQGSGSQAPEEFLDTRDPEAIYAAKEVLASMPDMLVQQELPEQLPRKLSQIEVQRRYRARKVAKERI